MRKYEIHLPLSYNDGEPIEEEKIRSAQDELIRLFGSLAVSDRKTWKYDGAGCIEVVKLEIVTADDKVPRTFLKDFKERVKESFRQSDILITTLQIQTL
jgi:hypothetical protein